MPFALHTLRKNISRASLVALSATALVACGGGGGGGSKKGGGPAAKTDASFVYPVQGDQIVDANREISITFGSDIENKNTLQVKLNGFDLAPFLFDGDELINPDNPTVRLFNVKSLLVEGDNKLQLKVDDKAWNVINFDADIDAPSPVITNVVGTRDTCLNVVGEIRKGAIDSASINAADVTVSGASFSNNCFDVPVAVTNDNESDITIAITDQSESLESMGGAGNSTVTEYAVTERVLEEAMAIQVNAGAFDVLGEWVGELLDPSLLVDLSEPILSTTDDDTSAANQLCKQIRDNNIDTRFTACKFYLADLVLDKDQVNISTSFSEGDTGEFLVNLEADLGLVEATLIVEGFAVAGTAPDFNHTSPQPPIEFGSVPGSKGGMVFDSFDSDDGGVKLTTTLAVTRSGLEIANFSMQPWRSISNPSQTCVGSADTDCVTQSVGIDIAKTSQAIVFNRLDPIEWGDAQQYNDIVNIVSRDVVGGGSIPPSFINTEISNNEVSLLNSVDAIIYEAFNPAPLNSEVVLNDRSLIQLENADSYFQVRESDGANIGLGVALNGDITEEVKSGNRVTGGLIGMGGNAQLTVDESRTIDPNDFGKYGLTSAIGSRFSKITQPLSQRLDVTQTNNDDAVWVVTENLANQMLTGLYQSGQLSQLIPPSLEVGPLLGSNAGSSNAVPLIPNIVSPTVKPQDELRIKVDMQSLPHVEFVEVEGESFIEMHLTGLEVKADVYKGDVNDSDYRYQCDTYCSGPGYGAISQTDPTGLRIPNALTTKLDVVARVQFRPNSVTQLPEVYVDAENISVDIVEFSTFIDRIYSRNDLRCTSNPTLQGSFACDEIKPFLYTKVMFMADLPEILTAGLGDATQSLLTSNVGGVSAGAFDQEKQLKFVMTSFGVNAAQQYMSLSVDVCDNGNDTPAERAGGECEASYGQQARGIYELTICAKETEWDAASLSCKF